MEDGLDDDDAAKPAMHQVEGVEGDAQHLDERVVPAAEEEQGDHVDNGQDTAPVPELLQGRDGVSLEVDLDNAEGDVGGEVSEQEDELQPRGQRAYVNGGAEAEFTVVALAFDRCIEDVLFHPREGVGRLCEVALRLVVQASDVPDEPECPGGNPPHDEGEGYGGEHIVEVVG